MPESHANYIQYKQKSLALANWQVLWKIKRVNYSTQGEKKPQQTVSPQLTAFLIPAAIY